MGLGRTKVSCMMHGDCRAMPHPLGLSNSAPLPPCTLLQILPGTHDSGAYQLARPGTEILGPWWKGPVYCLLASLARPLAAPWTLTQGLSLEEQLMLGCRWVGRAFRLSQQPGLPSFARGCLNHPPSPCLHL